MTSGRTAPARPLGPPAVTITSASPQCTACTVHRNKRPCPTQNTTVNMTDSASPVVNADRRRPPGPVPLSASVLRRSTSAARPACTELSLSRSLYRVPRVAVAVGLARQAESCRPILSRFRGAGHRDPAGPSGTPSPITAESRRCRGKRPSGAIIVSSVCQRIPLVRRAKGPLVFPWIWRVLLLIGPFPAFPSLRTVASPDARPRPTKESLPDDS